MPATAACLLPGMPNLPALGGLLHALVRPGLVVPHLGVADIAALDWRRLHAAGVRALVCDKDNCLVRGRAVWPPHISACADWLPQTKPHEDVLAPAIRVRACGNAGVAAS